MTSKSDDLAIGTFIEKWPPWIRWLLFLPAAVIVPILFFLVQSLIQTWFLDIGPNAFLLVLMRSIIYGAGFVGIGAVVAPAHQKGVALLLMIIVAMVVGVGIFAAIMMQSVLTDFAEALIILAAAAYTTYHLFQDPNN